MSRTLGPRANLDTFKKDAKRWRKAVRAGDAAAIARLQAALPGASADPTLRDVQLALAREYGFAGWAALKQALADRALARMRPEELVGLVLGAAWEGDRAAAARIADRHPELARHGIHAAVAFGDVEEVRRRLRADPSAARAKGGPLDWEPLLYLAYSRLPAAAARDDALALATLLLDHGADPNAWFDDGWGNPFKVLTGVVGRGEGDRPPHPRDRELAALLLDRGAEPFDTQLLYNCSIVEDDSFWLDQLWQRSAARGEEGRWTSIHEKSLGGERMSTVDYLLGNAVERNHLVRAEWLLGHGADPDGRNAYSRRPHHEAAQLGGLTEMTALLERHGAKRVQLSGPFAFHAACMRGDEAEARRLAAAHPEYLRHPATLHAAAERNRTDTVRLLLDLGVPVDIEAPDKGRALHRAAHAGALETVALLIEAGADIDRRGTSYQSTPLGHGVYWKNQATIDLIAPRSRDVHGLATAPRIERLRAVLEAEPGLANARNPHGLTPLLVLPDDEDAAAEVAELLIAHGADPRATDEAGETPARAAARRGLDDAAELIAEAAASDAESRPVTT